MKQKRSTSPQRLTAIKQSTYRSPKDELENNKSIHMSISNIKDLLTTEQSDNNKVLIKANYIGFSTTT